MAQRRGCCSGEHGETLVELLFTIVIMSVAFGAVLSGVGTAAKLSGDHRGQASAAVVLADAADSVKSQTLNGYVQCNAVTTSSYNPTNGVTAPSGTGWTPLSSRVTIVSPIKGWTGSAWAACTSGSTDKNLELITIQVTTPGATPTIESIDVIKRDPS
jgi:type II secretory pathway pseudopilin PulG